MSSVICLVTDPERAPISQALVRAVQRLAGGSGRWLANGEAVEFAFDPGGPAAMPQELAGELDTARIDWAILPAAGRRKALLLADMDSTMITVECIDELADAAGIKDDVAAITARAMNGEIDFKAALRARVALLAGLPEGVLQQVCDARVRPSPGAAVLVATMRSIGARTVLVSGGFTAFTHHVRQALGFDCDEANLLEIRDGRLTGRVLEPVRDAASKLAALMRHAAALGTSPMAALSLGDGANDLGMLQAAGLGIAYRAHPAVRAATAVRIDHTPLTTALFFQGIGRAEFVAG